MEVCSLLTPNVSDLCHVCKTLEGNIEIIKQ